MAALLPYEALVGLWESGRAAWPEIDLGLDRFARRLAGHASEPAPTGAHAADLFLACACADGVEGAAEALERYYLGRVPEFVRRVDRAPAFVDEVTQQLRARLLVGAADGRPRIGDYAGRGPLDTWLRVSAVRLALNHAARAAGPEPPAPDPPVDPAPEHEYTRARYRAEFQDALSAALHALAPERREVLRLLIVDRLSTAKIGERCGVNQSTVVRWVAAAREEIFDATWRRLHERLGVSPSEFDSIAAALLSDLQLSMARALA
jgi:RNA polymerase sigma-70 factor